jgi:hypothetical protein
MIFTEKSLHPLPMCGIVAKTPKTKGFCRCNAETPQPNTVTLALPTIILARLIGVWLKTGEHAAIGHIKTHEYRSQTGCGFYLEE